MSGRIVRCACSTATALIARASASGLMSDGALLLRTLGRDRTLPVRRPVAAGGMIIAIDAGNSRIKWGVHDGRKWLDSGVLATADVAWLARGR
jgi:hypothetical protein